MKETKTRMEKENIFKNQDKKEMKETEMNKKKTQKENKIV